MSKRVKGQARLRLAELGGAVIDGGLSEPRKYRSGRKSSRGTPETSSTSTTRSAGTPEVRHLWIACGEIPNALAKAPMPPDCLMASSIPDMQLSQPQVDFVVNLPLLVPLNHRFHPCGMSPLGKTIKAQLKKLGKSQSWLAEQCGVSEQAVSKWIKTGEIARENIKPAADALEISVAQLLDPQPTPELDERWHSLPPSVKQRVLALVDELTTKRRA